MKKFTSDDKILRIITYYMNCDIFSYGHWFVLFLEDVKNEFFGFVVRWIWLTCDLADEISKTGEDK